MKLKGFNNEKIEKKNRNSGTKWTNGEGKENFNGIKLISKVQRKKPQTIISNL